ncbi:MAG: GNAT family N-acetyltransferase [Alphaproteobacteria bacterium]|nr:GNAT family N-acetyltransferase [Alphaproteobacteria bacterium]
MTILTRQATLADVPLLHRMVRDLAAFENQPDAVLSSEADFARDGFGDHPRFEAMLAETSSGEPAGFALFYPTYSTWEGRGGLFIDDLFVYENHRGGGTGRLLIQAVARLALTRGCGRLELNVLDWNPARQFYERMGFEYLDEWLPMRARGDSLRRMAG